MNARRSNPVSRACTFALLGLLVAAPAVRAEVGVHDLGATGSEMPSPYIVGIITDEGNPIEPLFWSRIHPEGGAYRVLNADGNLNGDGRPDLVVHPTTRVPVVVWSHNAPDGFDVVISRYEQGAWTSPEEIADVSPDALDPRIAVDPATGDVHVVYWVDDATPRVEWRTAPADLSSWSPPETVSGPGERALRPHLAFHGGTLRVAYEVDISVQGGTPHQVVVARRDGGAFVPEIVATTHHEGIVRPEVHSAAGRMWIDWVDADGEVAWTRFDPASSQWEPIRIEPFAGLEEREYHVRGAVRAKALE